MSDGKMNAPQLPTPKDALDAVASFCTAAACNGGADALLAARETSLKAWEQMTADWLKRRHEASADARALLTRLRESRDVTEMLRAQQDWYFGAMRRFAADCAAWSPLATGMVETMSETARQVEATASEVVERAGRVPGEAASAMRSANIGAHMAARAARGSGQADAETRQ